MIQFHCIDRVLPFEQTRKLVVVGIDAEQRHPHAMVACCDLTWDDPHPFLSGVFVVESRRRQGIATAMMKSVIEEAVCAGKRSLALYCRPSNGAALALYEALGFARVLFDGENLMLARQLSGEVQIG